MAKTNSGDGSIRYYCTAGNGMERFLIDEVKKKLSAEDVRQMPAKAASELQSKLLGDRNQWNSALMTWSSLQGELTNKERTLTNQALRVYKKKEEEETCDNRNKVCSVESTKRARQQREEEERLRRGEQNGRLTQEKKKESYREEACVGEMREAYFPHREEEDAETSSESKSTKKERKRNAQDDNNGEEGEFADAHDSCGRKNVKKMKTSGRQVQMEEDNSCVNGNDHAVMSGIKDNGRDHQTEYSVENRDKEKISEGRVETHMQSSWIKPEPSFVPVTFRINCKCIGSLSRYFSTQEVSKILGVSLIRLMGWKTDLKNPEMEIHVYISDDYCLLGIPLTRLPLANRCYIKTTGLRSTVAWAMASLAQIQPGFCVIDPMCGVGTILIEAAQEHKAACFLGVDIDDGQLQKASENIEFSGMGNRIHLLKASSMALPLPSASVDAVVSDLPFGKKFGTKTDMAANLPLILTEMERVLCVGGSMVLLLSPQLSCLLKKFLAQKETGPMPNQPATRIQDSPSPSQSSTKLQTFQANQGVDSPPTQETDPQSGLPCSSLRHQATFRVSLGTIDGLIHKYVKMET